MATNSTPHDSPDSPSSSSQSPKSGVEPPWSVNKPSDDMPTYKLHPEDMYGKSSQSSKGNVEPLPWSPATVIAEKEDGIRIRTPEDKDKCRVPDSVLMADGTTLAITDYFNDAVKLVDVIKKEVISRIKIDSTPWGITETKPNQLAVTQPDSQKVQFMSVTGTSLAMAHEMAVSAKCWGIAHANHKLFISFTKPPHIEILTMSGEVLKTIETWPDGTPLFPIAENPCPQHLSLNRDNSLLFVSVYRSDMVYCMDLEGNVKADLDVKPEYEDDLEGPHGICAAGDDTMFLVGKYSSTIRLISTDLKKKRIIARRYEHDMWIPDSVAYCNELSTLYVGVDWKNKMKVFRLRDPTEK